MLANKDFLWVWFIHFIFQCINFILFLCSMFVIIRYKLHHCSFQKNNVYIYYFFLVLLVLFWKGLRVCLCVSLAFNHHTENNAAQLR